MAETTQVRSARCAAARARSSTSRVSAATATSALLSAVRMPPVSMARAARRPLNTVCSSERSSRLSVTTVFRKASSTSISSWLSARRVSPVKTFFVSCESRLDNVVYLLGWANSRAEARQLVVHGHYKVNGKKVDVPSYLLKAGDVVSIK